MSNKSLITLCCLALFAVGGWLSAQQLDSSQNDSQPANSTLTHAQFNLTPIGEKSAILLDVRSGDTWYLRNADPGTVWLPIQRFTTMEEFEKWREDR